MALNACSNLVLPSIGKTVCPLEHIFMSFEKYFLIIRSNMAYNCGVGCKTCLFSCFFILFADKRKFHKNDMTKNSVGFQSMYLTKKIHGLLCQIIAAHIELLCLWVERC